VRWPIPGEMDSLSSSGATPVGRTRLQRAHSCFRVGGTGKTIVALHRAVFLARSHPDSRVLLTTFSDTLANALRTKLRRLITGEPRLAERLEVHAMNAIAERLYELHFGRPKIASRGRSRLSSKTPQRGAKVQPSFPHGGVGGLGRCLATGDVETYRDVKRLGRKTRLSEAQRAALWKGFEAVRARLRDGCLVTIPEIFTKLAAHVSSLRKPPSTSSWWTNLRT